MNFGKPWKYSFIIKSKTIALLYDFYQFLPENLEFHKKLEKSMPTLTLLNTVMPISELSSHPITGIRISGILILLILKIWKSLNWKKASMLSL